MQIVGSNTWDQDLPIGILIEQSLMTSEDVKARGTARLREASIAKGERRMWCTWGHRGPRRTSRGVRQDE